MKANTLVTNATRKLTLILVFLIITTAVHAAAPKGLTKRQIASIKSQIPEAEEVFEHASVGPLRNDAGTHLVVIYRTRADRLRNEQRLQWGNYENISRCAIFGTQDNILVLLAKSGPLIDALRSGRDSVDCAIARGNVEIHHSNYGGGCSYYNERWKFNLSDDQFVLIGYDSVYSSCDYLDGSEIIYTETVTSVNFLTNEARLWRKAGEDIELWNRNVRIKKATQYKELSVQFELDEPFVFELFDINAFDAWMRRNKELCGYIDERDKYVPCRVSK